MNLCLREINHLLKKDKTKAMVWNYRIIENSGIFKIHEVYYNDTGEIIAISEDPIAPLGETLDELKRDLEHYLQAIERPILIRNEIGFAPMMEKENEK